MAMLHWLARLCAPAQFVWPTSVVGTRLPQLVHEVIQQPPSVIALVSPHTVFRCCPVVNPEWLHPDELHRKGLLLRA